MKKWVRLEVLSKFFRRPKGSRLNIQEDDRQRHKHETVKRLATQRKLTDLRRLEIRSKKSLVPSRERKLLEQLPTYFQTVYGSEN
jgi:hypothetical protein